MAKSDNNSFHVEQKQTNIKSSILADDYADNVKQYSTAGEIFSLDYSQNKEEDDEEISTETDIGNVRSVWSPTGIWWRDFLYFSGPGWLVSIAYVDPGNYQADIQAGATSRYTLLFALWWSSVLSIYVQVLCVRLAYYGQVTLAEVQALNLSHSPKLRYLNWFIAEFSIILTDLPEVIGIGIAMNVFFGWPYYAGVILSLVTTMIFLASVSLGLQVLEVIIAIFVGIMSVSLFLEMDLVGVDGAELMSGWAYGFVDVKSSDIFAITGILGAVVMPHNLYLHTAACQARPVQRKEDVLRQAVKWCSLEPILPILVSFFVNMAIVSIAAQSVYGEEGAEDVGLTDFCNYFKGLKGGCLLWGIALLSAGQSSAITTTFTGQYVMDGFLNIQLPVRTRAIATRLVAIIPCVIVSIAFPNQLNQMVNIVNSSLSFLLPFAFTPLVKYNCSEAYMGKFAAKKTEKYILYGFAIAVWAVNAMALSAVGGGFFGEWVQGMEPSPMKHFYIILEVSIQIFYLWWNVNCLITPVTEPMRPLEEEREEEGLFANPVFT